ncbi:signal transduction histidine kinase [Chloroherpeton thalassium ATCC 35110]|uniref:histidine kinase n=1 Tax=Chloroherpeton thalassium (strain ATCC 35110 / GB-78) TaxID=517418 RepID=B3QYS5_CHLT3|nr:PAS domain S-box protein [Chloroherpeton thalassium]ACF15148.1 signal transduction histidine kinase [Chloroherpeton thalassium ATCC 35110]
MLQEQITEKEKAESTLKHNEEFFRLSFSESPVATAIIDLNFRLLKVNRAFFSMMGCDEVGLSPFRFYDFLHHEDLSRHSSQLETLRKSPRKPLSFDARYIRKDGQVIWGHTVFGLIEDNHKNPLYYLAQIQDISERKAYQDVLNKKNRLLRSIADGTKYLLTITRPEDAVPKFLENIGQALDVDRIYLMQEKLNASTQNIRLTLRYEWSRPGVPSQSELVQSGTVVATESAKVFSKEHFNWDGLVHGEPVAKLTKDFPAKQQHFFEHLGIKSTLLVPIMAEGGFWGILGFDECKYERVWSPDEISILIAAASNIGSAFSRATTLKALQASEIRYRTLAANFPNGALALFNEELLPVVISGDGFLGDKNKQSELVGKPLSDIWPPKIAHEFEKALTKAFSGKKNSFELRHQEKDWQIWAVPNTEKDEHIGTVTAICIDITEQKNAHRLLLESERDYRGFFQNVHDAILICNIYDEILEVNHRASEIYGYAESELIGQSMDILCKYPARGRIHLNDTRRHGQSVGFEAIHIKKDGFELYMEINSKTATYKGQTVTISICRDINDKKIAEIALRDSERRSRRIIDTTAEGIWIINSHHRTCFVNHQTTEMLGYSEDEMLGKAIETFLSDDQNIQGLFLMPQSKKQKIVCDIQFVKKSGELLWAMVSASRMASENSKEGNLLLMFSDITERKIIEQALHKSERNYKTLAENLPRGAALIIDKDFNCILAAGNAFHRQGNLRPNTEGKPTDNVKPTDLAERLKDHYSLAFTGEKIDFQLEYLERWWQVYVVPNQDNDDNLIETITLIAYDITQHKKQEAALIESESRFRDIFNTMPLGMVLADNNGDIRLVNPAFEKMLGYSDAELYKKNVRDLTHEDDIERSILKHRNILLLKKQGYQLEKRYIRKDGKSILAKLTAKALCNDKDRSFFALGIVEDITEAKVTQERLRETQEQYFTLVKNFPEGLVMVIDEDYRCLLASGEAIKLGTRLIGRHPQDYCDAESLQILSQKYAQAFTGEKQSFELEFLNGYWMTHVVPNTWDKNGTVKTVSVICIDITKRKKIEDALSRSRERYRAIVNEMEAFVCRCTPDGNIAFINDTYCKVLSKSGQELLGINFSEIISVEDQPRFLTSFKNITAQHPVHSSEYRVLVNQEVHWHKYSATGIFKDDGLEEVQIIGHDITERKNIEIRLQASEEHFRFLAEHASDLIIHLSVQHEYQAKVTYISTSCQNILGYTREELMSFQLSDMIHPEDLPLFYKAYAKLVQQPNLPAPILYRHKHRSGKYIWLETLIKPICDEDGKILSAVMASRNVTERKRAEMALQESEERYRQVVENSPNPIFSADRAGVLHTWNIACEQSFECPQIEMLGKNWHALLAHPENAATLSKTVDAIFRGERESAELSVSYQNKRGEELYMVCRLYPLKNLFGEIAFCVFANMDISERFKYEQKLKASLGERDTLLKEVHHRVKNNLQVISSLLHLQKSKLQDPQAIQIFIDSQNRIHSMALIHQHLYQSDDLNNVDFAAYIDRLLIQLEITYGNPGVEFKTNVQNIKLSLDYAIPCGLLINEIIANSLKHAFQAIEQKGEIYVEMLYLEAEKALKICITDNGSGFNENITFENAQTLGFKLIRSFVTQLNGTVTVCGENGTRFDITLPC